MLFYNILVLLPSHIIKKDDFQQKKEMALRFGTAHYRHGQTGDVLGK